jgi:UDP-N-acetylglucosamine acyltransferase
MNGIHPTALLHPDARIGAEVTIGPFAVIDADVVIGDGCLIESHNRIGAGARIGNGCRIMHGAVVAASPDGEFRGGGMPTVTIGDRSIVREFVILNRGETPDENTILGTDCLLMACSLVEPGCMLGNTVIIANNARLGRRVRMDDFAIVGGQCAVADSVRIGMHSMTAGWSSVVKDVPPFVLAGRDPLAFEGLNLIGLRRRRLDADVIRTVDAVYSALYADLDALPRTIERLRTVHAGHAEVEEILDFVSESRHGIIRKNVS